MLLWQASPGQAAMLGPGCRPRPSAHRVRRVPTVPHHVEPHRAGIDHQEPTDQALPEADDLADHFHGHETAHNACERTQHPGLRTGRNCARRWWRGEKTAIGWVWRSVGTLFVSSDRGEGSI